MATTTRTTRRALAEGHQAQHAPKQRSSGRAPTVITAKHRTQIIATEHKTTRTQQNILPHRNSARMKRPLESINSNSDPLQSKRARIIEIPALSKSSIVSPRKTSIAVKRPQVLPPKPTTVAVVEEAPPSQPVLAPQPVPGKTATNSQESLTSHKKKLINGIKHELDRLHPNQADADPAKEHGRKLRSQEATRFKSELSAYFPDYDEVIGNDEKEHHILNVDTPILVVDSASSPHHVRTLPPRQATATGPSPQPVQQTHAGTDPSHHNRPKHVYPSTDIGFPVRYYGDELFTDLFDSQRIDFAFLEARCSADDPEDPLPDVHFELPHKKAERLEKSIRNTEKGRAQHEKDQIIRLLGDLQGHDWLRTMGVNGVTESRKKTFEPARDHFIKGCQTILEKFRTWSLEEKKRKLERERALVEEEVEIEEEEEEADVEEEEEGEDEEDEDGVVDEDATSEDEEMVDAESTEDVPDNLSDGDPPDFSDVDASIAKQLQEEVLARAKFAPSASSGRSQGGSPTSSESLVAKKFTSFFHKKYEREAALNKTRRSRRAVMAWGQNIPETPEENFELPEEFRDAETMRIHERRKRRHRRESRH